VLEGQSQDIGMSPASPPLLIEAKSLTKRYPGVVALDSVSFNLARGEVHALFGENGAGKSTLISMLAGASAPSAGNLLINGEPVAFRSVRDARALGICAVFQEFSLVPTLSVAQNIFLGVELVAGPLLAEGEMRSQSVRLLSELGFDINPDRQISSLTRGGQQMVEIAKAFRGDLSVLILDEPTASLSGRETERLFEFILRAKARGVGVIYISHRIQELDLISDRITVLRDGCFRGTVPAHGTSEAKLLEMMAGRKISEIYPTIDRKPGTEIMRVSGLHAKGVEGVSFTIRAGEVTGFAGLAGSGKSRVWRAVHGLLRTTGGRVMLGGRDVTGASVRRMMRAGVFYLPPNRKDEGLQLQASAEDNILLELLDSAEFSGPLGLISETRTYARAQQIGRGAGLDNSYLGRRVGQLSGGNQQKVLFAKGFCREFDLYVFDEPTVGVDMGTRAVLYRLIKTLADHGKAVVVISSYLPEVINLSHRILVFAGGRITAELEGPDIDETQVLEHFFTHERVDG
jgi:ribose transport system ATP-binding protein